MQIFLSHFDSSKFVQAGSTLTNEEDGIIIEANEHSGEYSLTMNGQYQNVEVNSGLHDLITQTCEAFDLEVFWPF